MSVPAGGALPPDVMLAHAGSIRALALSILGDEHAAEDVLQETWIRALEKPPPRQDSLGGWLRRVAEGLAISRLRSEGRRRVRETHWVEDRDCAHSSYDATERAEVLRAVVDEVLALEEPYREAVMRRYFEGLPPREIATATEASVATVNSRLQRAQAKLKEKLDRRLSDRCGGMRGALLVLVGMPDEAIAASTAGWFTHAVFSKAAVALAGVAAVVAVALWIRNDETHESPAQSREVASAKPAGGERRELVDAGESEGARAQIAPALGESTANAVVGELLRAPTPASYSFDLHIEPIDAQGIAVADCHVWLGPEPGPLALVGTTGWDGALRLAWRGEEKEVTFVVRAGLADSGSTPLRRIRVSAGGERVVRLALDGGRVPSEPDGLVDESVGFEDETSGIFGRDGGRPKRDEGRFLLDPAGNGVFEDTWLLAGVASTSLAAGHAALTPIVPGTPYGTASGFLAGGAQAVVEVRVVDAAGRAIVNAPVIFRTAMGRYTEQTWTGANGVALCNAAPSGAALVSVGARGTRFPLVVEHFERAPGAMRTIEVVLPNSAVARIRLVDAKGAPRAEWLYELRDENGSTIGRGAVDAEGRAVVPIPNDVPVKLLARADATGPAVVVDSALMSRESEQVVTAAFDPHVRTLRVVVRGADEPNVVVRVTRVDSGDALDAAAAEEVESGEEGAHVFRVRGLSHGVYRVAVGSPTRGWIDAGEHEITDGRGSEVVRVDVPSAARLEIANGATQRLRVIGRRAGMRIASRDVQGADGQKLTAAPGEYRLLVERDARTPPTVRAVELEPGATSRVE